MNYGMFSKDGNAAVTDMVQRLAVVARENPNMSNKSFFTLYKREVAKVAETHEEIGDTMVRETIAVDLVYLTGRNHWGVVGDYEAPKRWSKDTLEPKVKAKRKRK